MASTIIHFISHALGDNIAFSPYADLYQKKHGGKIYVKTKWYKILQSDNPEVEFVNLDFQKNDAIIKDIHFLFQRGPIQKIICNQLELEYTELKPSIKYSLKQSFKKKKKYVCIGTQSTAQCKYWNNNGGWDKLVNFLLDCKYDVYCIDKESMFGINGKWNRIPCKARDETGNFPIEYRIEQLIGCDFYIGVSSGLSWLAWALGKKVILISGCTDEDNEFKQNCYRVINKNVCHGCLNDPLIDNIKGIQSEWMYCPSYKNFECTKAISFDDVKDLVVKCIKDISDENSQRKT